VGSLVGGICFSGRVPYQSSCGVWACVTRYGRTLFSFFTFIRRTAGAGLVSWIRFGTRGSEG
jgi:hypothetical protein